MKDFYMILAVLAVIATPFFPLLLKSKCPGCRKRKLERLESLKIKPELALSGSPTYMTFYRCHACRTYFKQERSGCLQVCLPEEQQLAKSSCS